MDDNDISDLQLQKLLKDAELRLRKASQHNNVLTVLSEPLSKVHTRHVISLRMTFHELWSGL
jgi:hypothetical protein